MQPNRTTAQSPAQAAAAPEAERPAPSRPIQPQVRRPTGRISAVHIVCWQTAVAALIAATGRPPATLLAVSFLAIVVFGITAVRVRGRWAYEWIGLYSRFAARRRTWSEQDLWEAVSPGARLGDLELDGAQVGVVEHEAGMSAVLEVEPDPAAFFVTKATPLPSLQSLLPMVDGGELPVTVQAIVQTVPAPVGATAAGQSYRQFARVRPPAGQQGWVVLQASRTVDGHRADEIGPALRVAIRRTQRRLSRAGLTVRVLERAQLAEVLEDLSQVDDAGPLTEEWTHWQTPTSTHVTLAVTGWPDLSEPSALPTFDRLGDATGVPTVRSLSIRRTDRGIEVEAAVRVIAPDPGTADQSADEIRLAAAESWLRIRPLDGEQARGVAATLPLGGFLR